MQMCTYLQQGCDFTMQLIMKLLFLNKKFLCGYIRQSQLIRQLKHELVESITVIIINQKLGISERYDD